MDKNFDLNLHHIAQRIIREEVGKLLEYAHPRKQYIERAEGLFKQIVIHYFLIKYHKHLNITLNIHHWEVELIGWISNLAQMDIKGNNNADTKYKALITALENLSYLQDNNAILNCIIWVSKKENIDIKNDIIPIIIEECKKDLITIVKIIATNNAIECDKFISTL